MLTSLIVKLLSAIASPQDLLVPVRIEVELQTAKARASRKPIHHDRHMPQMRVTFPQPKPASNFWPRARSRLRKRP